MTGTIEPNPGLDRFMRTTARTAGDPLMVSGTLVDQAGQPIPGEIMRADIDPIRSVVSAAAEDVGVAPIEVGKDTTNANGAFSIRVPQPSDWDSYVEPDGSIRITLLSAGPTHQYVYHVTLVPPATADGSWRWSEYDAAVVDAEAAPARVANEETLIPDNLLLVAEPEATGTARLTDAARGICGGYDRYWKRSDRNKWLRGVKIQRVRTLNDIRIGYDWSNTKETRTDSAINTGRDGALVKGGFTSVQNDSSGVDYSVSNNEWKDLQAQFDYRAWDLFCVDPTTGEQHPTNRWEYRPYKFTGGNRQVTPGSGPWSCQDRYSVSIEDTLWVAKTTSNTFSAGVDLGFLNLRSNQSNSSTHKLTINPDRRTRICGSNAYPVNARMVREHG